MEVAETLGAGAGRFAAKDLMQFLRMQRGTNMNWLKQVMKLEVTFKQAGFEEVGKQMFKGRRSTVGILQTL